MAYQPIIAHIDDDYIRVSQGIADPFLRPTFTIKACYGVPKAGQSSRASEPAGEANGSAPDVSRSDWLFGEKLDAALAEDADKVELRWPFQNNRDLEKQDWEGRAFILSNMYSVLNVKTGNNTFPLLLVPPMDPPTYPLSDQALYCQLVFETLNAPQLSMIPAPLATLFGLNSTTGVVLHVGRHTSQAVVVTESVVRWETATSVDLGEADCEEFLEGLLLQDAPLDKELKTAAEVESWAPGQKEKLVREVREFIFAECTSGDIEVPENKAGHKSVVVVAAKPQEEEGFDVAKKLTLDVAPQMPASNSHKSKKQQAAAAAAAASKAAADADAAIAAIAADVIIVTIPSLPGKEIAVGALRHRICEPLLKGKTPGGDTVWEALGRAVEGASLTIPERLLSWDSIAVIGDMARFKTFPASLVTHLAPFLLTSAELPSDSQPLRVRLLSIPDYISNFKNGSLDLAPFLGASMVAKVAFGESQGKHSISKIDYNAHGPSAIYGVWQD